MKKKLFITGALAVFLLGSFKKDGDWVRYKSTEGKYSISFPGKPTESIENDTSADGTVLVLHMAMYQVSDNEVYLSSYIDMHSFYPAEKSLKQILEDSRDGAASSMKATNIVTTATNLGDNPYIEFVFTSIDATGKDRIYMIDKFQYSVITLFAVSKGIGQDADKFLTSFKHI